MNFLAYLCFFFTAVSAATTGLQRRDKSTVLTDLETIEAATKMVDYSVELLPFLYTLQYPSLDLQLECFTLIQSLRKGAQDIKGVPALSREEASKLPVIPVLKGLVKLPATFIKQKGTILKLTQSYSDKPEWSYFADESSLLEVSIDAYIDGLLAILPADLQPPVEEERKLLAKGFKDLQHAYSSPKAA